MEGGVVLCPTSHWILSCYSFERHVVIKLNPFGARAAGVSIWSPWGSPAWGCPGSWEAVWRVLAQIAWASSGSLK